MPHDRPSDPHPASGVASLLVDAVVGASEVVESMHARISPVQPSPRDPRLGRARGLSGFVYRSIRGVARMSGRLGSLLLRRVPAAPAQPSRRGQALLAALNGVAGDHLARLANPLAVPMQLRLAGRPLENSRRSLADAFPDASERIVVLVHGLCTSDLQWTRRGHDHGAALAADVGCTSLYLHYNTGLHVSENGEALADLLEALVGEWPVAVRELVLLGHSMGGLVARSACHSGMLKGQGWIAPLRSIVCLGTPHEGSPHEVRGQRLHRALGGSSFTAPLSRLAAIRSAGITDLRRGNVVEEDWAGADRFAEDLPRSEIRFPGHVRCYLVAATLGRRPGDLKDRLFGDHLVPTMSALGRGARPVAAAEHWTGYGMSHFDLLDHPEVYARLKTWLRAT